MFRKLLGGLASFLVFFASTTPVFAQSSNRTSKQCETVGEAVESLERELGKTILEIGSSNAQEYDLMFERIGVTELQQLEKYDEALKRINCFTAIRETTARELIDSIRNPKDWQTCSFWSDAISEVERETSVPHHLWGDNEYIIYSDKTKSNELYADEKNFRVLTAVQLVCLNPLMEQAVDKNEIVEEAERFLEELEPYNQKASGALAVTIWNKVEGNPLPYPVDLTWVWQL